MLSSDDAQLVNVVRVAVETQLRQCAKAKSNAQSLLSGHASPEDGEDDEGVLLRFKGKQLVPDVDGPGSKQPRRFATEATCSGAPSGAPPVAPTLASGLESLSELKAYELQRRGQRLVRAMVAAVNQIGTQPQEESGTVPFRSLLTHVRGLELRHADLTADDVGHGVVAESPNTGGAASSLVAIKPVRLASLLLSPHMPWSAGSDGHVLCRLHTLDLECNALGDDGIRALSASALPWMPCLRRLHLASNNFHAEGLRALVDVLCGPDGHPHGTRALEVVGLTNNPVFTAEVADHGVEAAETAQQLVRLCTHFSHTLRRVHLNHVGMTSSAGCTLLEAVLLSSVPTSGEARENTLAGDLPSPLGRSLLPAFPRLDTLYLKQNSDLDQTEVHHHLQQRVEVSKGRDVDRLIHTFVLW